MAGVFSDEISMFFVGGNGTQGGRTPDAGGCTQAWWDSECPNNTDAEKMGAITKLMTHGAPVVDQAGCSFSYGPLRITSTGNFTNVEVGMIFHAIETPVPNVKVPTGRYRITAVDPGGDWIDVSIQGATGSATVTVKVGGAFDTLQNALDDTDASDHSVIIHTNLPQTLSASIDVDAGGGDILKNTFKKILGYRQVPGDMNRGGAYYESALEILTNGSIDANYCIPLNGNNGGFPVLDINGVDNLVFENLHLKNANTGESGDAVNFSSVVKNIVLRNCRFSDVVKVMNTEADHVMFDGCYSHDDIPNHHYVVRGYNNVQLGCVAKLDSLTNLVNFNGRSGVVIGCIAVGGQFGVRVGSAGAAVLVAGNTFYNTNNDGVYLNGGDGVVVVNNIFCLAPGAVGIYVQSGGSVVHNDYNCFIESDGTPLTPTGTEYSGGETPVMGVHSVQADPDFVDAANGDFRARNPLLLRGGRPGPDGRAAVIGVMGQEYQFAKRARVMNAGRAGIIR